MCTVGVSRSDVTLYSGPYVHHSNICWYMRQVRESNYSLLTSKKWDIYNDSTHPEPESDITGWYNTSLSLSDYIFGFTSLTQMRQWFPDEFIKEAKYLYIHTYLIDSQSILVGERQIAFEYRAVQEEVLDSEDLKV